MNPRIIGREQEQKELLERYNSNRAEFVAVYGRRRVGKTFLIRETFKDKITFSYTGLSVYDEDAPVTTADQLQHFYHSLLEAGSDCEQRPKTWLEAMYMLQQLLVKLDDGSRQVVFIDELPWLDTPRSRFVVALEAFWNGWASARDNIMLVVCGSATSWMLNHLINNAGGLYGRLTWYMKLSPFTLYETEKFLQSQGIEMSRYDTVQAYMALGGIPYYLGYFVRGKSLAQNIDALLFGKNAKLRLEFKRLFHALFKYPEKYIEIVKLLATKHHGFTRDEIASHINSASGGTLSSILETLEQSDFVVRYRPFDSKRGETLYKLIDPYCRTYLHFIEQHRVTDSNYWQHGIGSAAINSWCGIAFEEICMMHQEQIKHALGISAVRCEVSAFTLRGDENHDGMQCDLILRRNDHVVNLCEIKYSQSEYEIDKSYDRVLRNRLSLLRGRLKATETPVLTFITTFGVKHNSYYSIVQNEVTIEELFKF